MSIAPWALLFGVCLCIACAGPPETKAGPDPVFTARGIAADPNESQQEPAPGMMVSLYGEHLGPEAGCTAEPPGEGEPYPDELCETRVLFGDLAAQILYAGPSQINLRIPSQVPAGATTPVRVVFEGRSSPPVPIAVSKRKQLAVVENARALSQALLDRLQAVSWDAAIDPWRRQHPDAVCELVQSGADSASADEPSREQCVFDEGFQHMHWFFYASETHAICRLVQFQAVVTGVTGESVQETYNGLRRLLARRYGVGDTPERVLAQGSASWRQLRRWRVEGRAIYLYVSKPLFEPTHVGLLARVEPFAALAR
jgi:hypothetical protein